VGSAQPQQLATPLAATTQPATTMTQLPSRQASRSGGLFLLEEKERVNLAQDSARWDWSYGKEQADGLAEAEFTVEHLVLQPDTPTPEVGSAGGIPGSPSSPTQDSPADSAGERDPTPTTHRVDNGGLLLAAGTPWSSLSSVGSDVRVEPGDCPDKSVSETSVLDARLKQPEEEVLPTGASVQGVNVGMPPRSNRQNAQQVRPTSLDAQPTSLDARLAGARVQGVNVSLPPHSSSRQVTWEAWPSDLQASPTDRQAWPTARQHVPAGWQAVPTTRQHLADERQVATTKTPSRQAVPDARQALPDARADYGGRRADYGGYPDRLRRMPGKLCRMPGKPCRMLLPRVCPVEAKTEVLRVRPI